MDSRLFLLLFAASSLPMILLFLFSPWEIPHIQYFFLGVIFVLRIIFFREEEFKKKLRLDSKSLLQKKMNRIPSEAQVIAHIDKRLEARNISFVMSVVVIFVVTIAFGKF